MNQSVAMPMLLPLAAAALSFLAWRRVAVQFWICLAGAGGSLIASVVLLGSVQRQGILAAQVAGWAAPFGITLVADLFTVVMLILAGIKVIAVMLYSVAAVDKRRKCFGYYPMVQVLLAGVCGAFLTGDIFNLFVWFEVLLISSFVLLSLGGERPQLEGGIKYVTLNLIASALFLAAVGLLYGIAGTLNMADLSVRLAAFPDRGPVLATGLLLFVAFGIKAAIFPLFFWLPAAYHTPPIPVSALFAALLSKVGVYALIRAFTLVYRLDVPYTHSLIVVASGLTMVSGVLGAAAQTETRRILSFHIISQIGYMIMGLGLFTPLALAGSIFYVGHNMLAKSNLFLVSGIVYHLRGSYRLDALGDVWRDRPGVGFLFLIPAFALAGLPPLSGFVGKVMLARAGFDVGAYGIVAVALFVSVLTLYSMVKIWIEVFWKPQPVPSAPASAASPPPVIATLSRGSFWLMAAPCVALAALTVALGVVPQPFIELTRAAAEQLLDPDQYIRAVFGPGGQP